MLSNFTQTQMLEKFPNIKLSYENIIHKKVYNSELIVVIPEGTKCFVWFTYVDKKQACLIMELNKYKKIINIKREYIRFSRELSYGTILYGTLFNHLNNVFLSVEDIFSYKGIMIDKENLLNKLYKMQNIFKNDLKQVSSKSRIIFGLPVMCKTSEELNKSLSNIKYKIHSIHYKLFNKINNYLCFIYTENFAYKNLKNANNTYVEAVFLIRSDIQDDIYNLFCVNNELKEQYHSIAHIKDYNASVMMNSLFRIIKENKNLDALEESDDEEEFNNDKCDKFLQKNAEYKMICVYNFRFKRWAPLKVTNEPITTFANLSNLFPSFQSK